LVTAVDPPPFRPEQEVRYALVLYGGVSLAVYINGVVQEFFRLVRSTAPEWPLSTDPDAQLAWFPAEAGSRGDVKPLRGSERVYRRLGQLLPNQAGAALPPAGGAIRTRFVVDILSGTSAGGLNGIVLAKALANQQSIAGLCELWLKDGDIGVLLNDAKSLENLKYDIALQRPPRSLLNGYRFFVKALETFEKMRGTEERAAEEKSPSYAEQIDLVVTTTDLQGLVLPIKLYDRVVQEPRHKYVFRFAYWTKEATGARRNDFALENDAMLAFAARCTSSFPFAFEPMVLDDLADVLPASRFPREGEPWPQFFGDYRRMKAKYREFAYADGGYLDNKPFSYATEQLERRRADVPVDRRLVYIEPDPSDPLPDLYEQEAKDRPEVFENVVAALTKLPRAETIREDVDAVVSRSRSIARIREVTAGVVEEVAAAAPGGGGVLPVPSATYWALRRQVLVDELADSVGRVAGIAQDSDAQYALRLVAREWAEDVVDGELFDAYDLGFRLRRLTFVQHRVNDLLRGVGAPAKTAALQGLWTMTPATARRLRQVKMALNEILVELRWRGRGVRQPRLTAAQLEAEPDETLSAKPQHDAAQFEAVAQAVEATELTAATLVDAVLDPENGTVRSEDDARERASALAGLKSAELDHVAAALKAVFDLPFRANEAAARLVLGAPAAPGNVDAVAEAEATAWLFLPKEDEKAPPAVLDGLGGLPPPLRGLLRWYYDAFEQIDAMLLPLTYPDLGEVNPVEIIRISPQDATSLIDEEDDPNNRRKLAGTSVHHFGGFLDRKFRANDILWGRLDGAERIIETTLPPDHPQKDFFVEAAQLGIIREDLLGANRERWVTDALTKADTAQPRSGSSLDEFRELLGPDWTDERLRAALAVRACLDDEHEVEREPDRQKMLNVVGRAATISSDVVGAAADSIKSFGKPLFWVARVGRLLTGLAALATPPRFGYLPRTVFKNVAAIAFLIGIVLVLLGILGVDGAHKSGWIVLGLTALAQVVVWAATAWIGAPSRNPGNWPSRLWKWVVRFLITLVVVALLAATGLGVVEAIDRISDWF
jgi:patatin-related protein